MSALHQNFDPENPHPRSSRSWKWKNVLKNIWEQLNKQEDVVNDEQDEENEERRRLRNEENLCGSEKGRMKKMRA